MPIEITRININYESIRDKVFKQALTPIREKAQRIMRERVDSAQKIMVNTFDSHPVTLEIKAGKEVANFSGTLGGYGNLFTYIGFEDGSDPTSGLRNLLNQQIQIIYRGFLLRGREQGDLRFEVKLPSILALEAVSEMPWASGESWATGIEEGISGIGQYLALEARASRSGGGIQNVKMNLPRSFNTQPYLSTILKSFVDAFNR